jgi:WD40 repeat protein
MLQLETVVVDLVGDGFPRGFSFTPSGDSFLIAHLERAAARRWLTCWNTKDWTRRWTTPSPDAAVEMAMMRDGARVATVYRPPIRIWDVATGALIEEIAEHAPVGAPLLALPDERVLVGYRPPDAEASLSIWDTRTGESLGYPCVPKAHWIVYADVAPPGDRLATCAFDGALTLWELPAGRRLHDFAGNVGGGRSSNTPVAFHPVGDRVIVGAVRGEAGPVVFAADTGAKLAVLPGVEALSDARALAISRCGRWLAGAYGWHEDDHWPWHDARLRVWDLGQRALVREIEETSTPLDVLAFSPDGKFLVGRNGEALALWSVREGD